MWYSIDVCEDKNIFMKLNKIKTLQTIQFISNAFSNIGDKLNFTLSNTDS